MRSMMRSLNIFQYDTKIHTDIICALLYLSLSIWRDSIWIWNRFGFNHVFSIGLKFQYDMKIQNWWQYFYLTNQIVGVQIVLSASDRRSKWSILCKQKIFSRWLRFQTGLIFSTLLYILCCCRFVFILNVHTILPFLDQSIYDGMNKNIKEDRIKIIDGKSCSSVIFCCMTLR